MCYVGIINSKFYIFFVLFLNVYLYQQVFDKQNRTCY